MAKHRHIRRRYQIHGAVQGVGFRPFVFRLAQECQCTGWVMNTPGGLIIEAEGKKADLDSFSQRLQSEPPEHALIQGVQTWELQPTGFKDFEIRESDQAQKRTALVLPDMATCPECVKELFDENDRRYRYPFINCTHCGPRFSIIESLPYDRVKTTMKGFKMCVRCETEYHDPQNRRFHAQPNACSACGPQVTAWDQEGKPFAEGLEAIRQTTIALKAGRIVAVKGLGGFHLFADARCDEVVQELRRRKHREEKPFAVMFPNLDMIREYCEVSKAEGALLTSSVAPIVLLKRRSKTETEPLPESLAPGNPYWGCFLPYTPLHHIIMKDLMAPMVATSGNISDEPICIDEHEAVNRLQGIAELFLVHNRPIVRHVDDSVARVMALRPLVLRRGRGYAPLPIAVNQELPGVMAYGPQLKNTVALSIGQNVFVSQHIGDLETKPAFQAYEKAMDSLKELYDGEIEQSVCDMHPDYVSTQKAKESKTPLIKIQHHHAHIVSAMAENDLQGEVLGLAWDGTGYGMDGTIWGGEFLKATRTQFERVAGFLPFRLPGGEGAIKSNWRIALSLLYQTYGEEWKQFRLSPAFQSVDDVTLNNALVLLKNEAYSPLAASVGRLFDGVSALIGVRNEVRFEGQAAMELEFAVKEDTPQKPYPIQVVEKENREKKSETLNYALDWTTMVKVLMDDVLSGVDKGVMAARFHQALIHTAVDICQRLKIPRVVLSGGCFQNRILTEGLIEGIRAAGLEPFWHQNIPPNDGGIALGQAVAAGTQRFAEETSEGEKSCVLRYQEK